MLTASPHERACKQCGKTFQQLRPMQAVCGPICAGRYVRESKKQEKRADRAKREAMKTIPDLIKEAQRSFNEFIRLRDKGRDCICCPGTPLGTGEVGGAYDCGHWRSVGSAPHLRFDERNAHGQNKRCNRYGAGRAVDYRRGLIDRIGMDEVIAIESDNRVHKWQREELISIAKTYRAKARELKKQSEAAADSAAHE